MPAHLPRLVAGLTVLLLFVHGCGDDEPTRPPATPTGTIVITLDPEDLEVPWLLSGPAGFSMAGQGATTVAEAPVGSYQQSWGAVAGWLAPEPLVQTDTLAADQTVVFAGLYTPDIPEAPAGFRLIPAGTFVMGSPDTEPGRNASREAQHEVTLTRAFWMAEHAVTEQLYAEVIGGASDSQLPQVMVSWNQAIQFCNALSLRDGLEPAYAIHGPGQVTWDPDADGYRLPTEAEWEYACRALTTTAFHNGTDCLSADTEANYNGTLPLAGCPEGIDRGERTVVGSFPANAWGLFDMHGNVAEWCWDVFQADHVALGATDPIGGGFDQDSTANRTVRGGHYSFNAAICRSAHRNNLVPNTLFPSTGFRVVRTVIQD